jgi:hypothetical protein
VKKILICVPGPPVQWDMITQLREQAERAKCGQVWIDTENRPWALNVNHCWARALNAGKNEGFTHVIVWGTDIIPLGGQEPNCIDALVKELADTGADLISVTVPIRNASGILCQGVGEPHDPWHIHRRFTVRETLLLKRDTFDGTDFGYDASYPLMHNFQFFIADLSRPVFYATENGEMMICFDFPQRIRPVVQNGVTGYVVDGEEESWYFSRNCHESGVKSFLTRKVKLYHRNRWCNNYEAWGDDHDDKTAANWEPVEEALQWAKEHEEKEQ